MANQLKKDFGNVRFEVSKDGSFQFKEIGSGSNSMLVTKVIGCKGSWHDGSGNGRIFPFPRPTLEGKSGTKTCHVLSHQTEFPCPNPDCDEMKDIQNAVERDLLSQGKITESDLPVDDRTIFNHPVIQSQLGTRQLS